VNARHHPSSPHAVGRRLALACAVTALVLVLEIAGGLFTHSLALLSDAGHVFGDLFALALSAYALKLAQTPPDRIRPSAPSRRGVRALVNGVP
jgi:cobalt-zinc-cadmium efflux system protein